MAAHNLSRKEKEVLERQRQLASQLRATSAGSKNTEQANGAKPSIIERALPTHRKILAKPSVAKDKTAATKETPVTRRNLSSLLDLKGAPPRKPSSGAAILPPAALKPKSPPTNEKPASQKRPSLKRPSLQSSSALIAAARKKVATASRPTATESAEAKPSPKLIRKKVTSETKGSSLKSLVEHMASSTDVDMNSDAVLPTIKPDDYWKRMREWDLLAQLAESVKSQQSPDANPDEPKAKPLPNVFLNARHYMAAWAPLCLAESRAQILQELCLQQPQAVLVTVQVSSQGGGRRRQNSSYDPNTWDETESGGYVVVQPKHRGDGSDLSFFANDLCLLLRKQQLTNFQDLLRGNGTVALRAATTVLAECQTAVVIGHTELPRRELAGLLLKVSKIKWAKIGQPEMYLVPLPGNPTALRDFTALCSVDRLPMKRFLFAQHLEDSNNRRKLSSSQGTDRLLQQLGGQQALGAGFMAYAKKKFNASQLTAIAASAHEYGNGGFTLIKGPPGTGKTTTLVAVLNSLHIRQYNKYYEEVRRISAQTTGSRQAALQLARKAKPRLLVCAPSNAAVDNIILKIMEDGFVDGQGNRYNPSMIRVGVGQSAAVRAVSLESKVDAIFSEFMDAGKLETSLAGYRVELQRITNDITNLRKRIHAIQSACSWPLSKDWEIRVDESTFDETNKVYFVNHKDKKTTYEIPPPPEPGETQFPATSMPEYRAFLSRIVKLVENYFSVKSQLERCTIVKGALENGANHLEVRQSLESHVLNSVHMVMTTLGTAGGRTLEVVDKFEVVVVDEAAQSVEPASLSALQLGSRQAVLVGDPQQLPATIFNMSGRNSKFDRSLFQRLEEAGQPIYMLDEQYRMHPRISHFPRHIFYGGALKDGPNVQRPDYGDPLRSMITSQAQVLQPFLILDLDSKEERGGTSLSNSTEANLTVHLYQQIKVLSRGLSATSRVAVITPYSQQVKLLRTCFSAILGPRYEDAVEINTVDAFQGREANIVIFSAVRAAGSRGIGFLSDVRRMNVALTRAKHFLFVIARCDSIVINKYWKELVEHAKETNAIVRVPVKGNGRSSTFGDVTSWTPELPERETSRLAGTRPTDPRK